MMAEITAQLVSELRKRTGVGLMDCKRALTESGGDLDKAIEQLRIQGLATAAKKAGRETNEGIAGIWINEANDAGLMLEVFCETDFVARTDDFQGLVALLQQHFASGERFAQTALYEDAEELLAEPFFADTARTVRDIIGDAVGKIGENIQFGRLAVVNLAGRTARVQQYMHMGGKVSVLVGLEAGKPETLKHHRFLEAAKDLSLQVAAGVPVVPVAVSRDGVPADVLANEKRIVREQTLKEGKPENLVDKIVEGRMNKFFKEAVLLEQPFIKDDKQSVKQMLDAAAKELGDTVAPVHFFRFAIGGD